MGCQLLLDQNILDFDLNTPPQPSPSQGRELTEICLASRQKVKAVFFFHLHMKTSQSNHLTSPKQTITYSAYIFVLL